MPAVNGPNAAEADAGASCNGEVSITMLSDRLHGYRTKQAATSRRLSFFESSLRLLPARPSD